MYPALRDQTYLNEKDVLRLASLLHNRFRNSTDLGHDIRQFYPLVEQITSDIRQRRVPPSPPGHVHLLGIYKHLQKYEEGSNFWIWLAAQDDTYVSQAVYGAAIELLAFQKKHSLEQLEEIYLQGLKRFPGGFAEYHLSPEAIVPDRSQYITIPGLPITLLQAILTARILAGDWKGSYLALDTALRLYPSQTPARFFELFVYERHILEGYTCFLMACQAGKVLNIKVLNRILAAFRSKMDSSNSLETRLTLLRGIVTAVYSHTGLSGKLRQETIGSLLTAFAKLVPPPREDKIDSDNTHQKTCIAISETVQGSLEDLIKSGVPRTTSMTNGLISVAARLQRPDLLPPFPDWPYNSITRRCLLKAAGSFRDKKMIEHYWNEIVELEGDQLFYQHWVTLAVATYRADHMAFFAEQKSKLAHTLTSDIEDRVGTALARAESTEPVAVASEPTTGSFQFMPYDRLRKQLEGIRGQIRQVANLISSGELLNFYKHPVDMFLDASRMSLGPIEDLRAIYDELTTDNSQRPVAVQHVGEATNVPQPALSPTGIQLDRLRFLNWATITELMNDAAIAEGDLPPYGPTQIPTRNEVRERVKHLRGLRTSL